MESYINWLTVFLVGLCIGSFTNVCIYRWTVEQSIFKPLRSHCPCCNAEIIWYDNIPLFSFINLGGRCRTCGSIIPLQYPTVELFTALMAVAIFLTYGATFEAVKIMFLFWMFLVSVVTDWNDRIIPNEVAIAGIAFAIGSVIAGYMDWFEVLLGFLFPSVPLLLLTVGMEWLLKKEGLLGGGDIKFLFAVGGVGGALFASRILFFGCFCLSVAFFGIFLEDLVTKRRTPVPMMTGFAMAFVFMFLLGLF